MFNSNESLTTLFSTLKEKLYFYYISKKKLFLAIFFNFYLEVLEGCVSEVFEKISKINLDNLINFYKLISS